MHRILTVTSVALLLACGGKNDSDDRGFGSLSASFGSTYGQGDEDAVVVPSEDTIVIDKGIDGGVIDSIGKGVITDPGKGTETPKTPELPKDIQDKLAKCWPQWDKGASTEKYEIREVNVNVDKLLKSNIQLAGDVAEVVFVNIVSASYIENVNLSLENAKGLYCLDISAAKDIKYLDIAYVCGAKLGLVDIEAGKAKKVNIREVCNQP